MTPTHYVHRIMGTRNHLQLGTSTRTRTAHQTHRVTTCTTHVSHGKSNRALPQELISIANAPDCVHCIPYIETVVIPCHSPCPLQPVVRSGMRIFPCKAPYWLRKATCKMVECSLVSSCQLFTSTPVATSDMFLGTTTPGMRVQL